MLSLTKRSASVLHNCLSTPPRHSPSHNHIFRLQPQRPRASLLPTQVSCWAQQRCGTLEGHVHLHTASLSPQITRWGSDGNAQSQPHTKSTCSHSHTKSSYPQPSSGGQRRMLSSLAPCPKCTLWLLHIAGTAAAGTRCSPMLKGLGRELLATLTRFEALGVP